MGSEYTVCVLVMTVSFYGALEIVGVIIITRCLTVCNLRTDVVVCMCINIRDRH